MKVTAAVVFTCIRQGAGQEAGWWVPPLADKQSLRGSSVPGFGAKRSLLAGEDDQLSPRFDDPTSFKRSLLGDWPRFDPDAAGELDSRFDDFKRSLLEEPLSFDWSKRFDDPTSFKRSLLGFDPEAKRSVLAGELDSRFNGFKRSLLEEPLSFDRAKRSLLADGVDQFPPRFDDPTSFKRSLLGFDPEAKRSVLAGELDSRFNDFKRSLLAEPLSFDRFKRFDDPTSFKRSLLGFDPEAKRSVLAGELDSRFNDFKRSLLEEPLSFDRFKRFDDPTSFKRSLLEDPLAFDRSKRSLMGPPEDMGEDMKASKEGKRSLAEESPGIQGPSSIEDTTAPKKRSLLAEGRGEH